MSRVKVPVETKRLYDATSSTIQYYGEAADGATTSEYCWKITRLVFSGPNLSQMSSDRPNGSSNYEFAWDNRTSYTYK